MAAAEEEPNNRTVRVWGRGVVSAACLAALVLLVGVHVRQPREVDLLAGASALSPAAGKAAGVVSSVQDKPAESAAQPAIQQQVSLRMCKCVFIHLFTNILISLSSANRKQSRCHSRVWGLLQLKCC